mgnify:CR=1 FL=1|tara:strand:+ start:763 stop:1119 length:357 start_codon:yes stop_codon:yes gene_type:complete
MDQEIDKLFRDINGELEKIISEKNNTNASIKKNINISKKLFEKIKIFIEKQKKILDEQKDLLQMVLDSSTAIFKLTDRSNTLAETGDPDDIWAINDSIRRFLQVLRTEIEKKLNELNN